MALQQNYNNIKFGIIMYNAYWRINSKNGLTGGKDEMNYVIEVFKDANMSHVEYPQALERFTFMFVPNLANDANNFLAQAYSHAKTLGFFSGSVDV